MSTQLQPAPRPAAAGVSNLPQPAERDEGVAAPGRMAERDGGSLLQRLDRLHELARQSGQLLGFGAAPGWSGEGPPRCLPHFIHWPHAAQESLRLAVLAGFGRHDRLATLAVLAFIERLARQPDAGDGLNLSLFPLVNVRGLLGGAEERDLTRAHWGRSDEPEIVLLNQDARLRGYQGFVRVTTTADELPFASVRSSASVPEHQTQLEVFAPEDFHPWEVRFETIASGSASHGPLSIADDLPFAPFEVELALPYDWPQAGADQTLATMLKRLILRYRSFLAYGQHL